MSHGCWWRSATGCPLLCPPASLVGVYPVFALVEDEVKLRYEAGIETILRPAVTSSGKKTKLERISQSTLLVLKPTVGFSKEPNKFGAAWQSFVCPRKKRKAQQQCKTSAKAKTKPITIDSFLGFMADSIHASLITKECVLYCGPESKERLNELTQNKQNDDSPSDSG